MAEDFDLLDSLFDETEPQQQKEIAAAKFKPKNTKNLSKPSILKLQTPSIPTDTLLQSQHGDSLLGPHSDCSLTPCMTTDKFEGASNMKTKLQPQRKKHPAQPGFDGFSDIHRNEIPDNEIEATFSSGVDLSRLDFQAPTSLSDIDLLDDVSLEPLLSGAEPAIEHPEENEKDGKAKKVQANDASESGMEETTENDEQGQNSESMGGKEKEDAPNLDEIFDFLDDDTDPILEMNEADDDPTDKDYTGEEEINGREEKELKNADQKPSKRTRGSSNAEEQAEEGSPKKRGKLPHQIRRKRRKVDPTLLETPENEINPRQISIRNLILLAEAKEKKWNKEAASRNSGDASSMPRRREPEEFEFFDFEEGEEENSRHDSAPQETFEATTKKLNYHTYMNRSSSSRWTQLETELFYKGIYQFGTDFAMIQQLFPNRTRHQIKLKFKNEDKKYPARIRDAITHRPTDNSQFEKVIEILEIQPDKVLPEESEPSSKAAHWKNEEEIDEVENSKTSFSDLNDTGKQESVLNDDLDAVFDWDNQEMEQEDFVS